MSLAPRGMESQAPRAKRGSTVRPTFHAALGHTWDVAIQKRFIDWVRHRGLRHRVGHESLATLAAHSILSC
jgi:hypothetical protein